MGAIDTTCTQKGCRWNTGEAGQFCFTVGKKLKVGNRDKDPESWAKLYQCPNMRYTETLQVLTAEGCIDLVTVTVTNAELSPLPVDDHHARVNDLRQQKIEEWASRPENLAAAEAKLAGHTSLLEFK